MVLATLARVLARAAPSPASSPSTHAADNFTHYPPGSARYRIHACVDATRTHVFGDGTFVGDTVANYADADADVTEGEAWELRGITDPNDLGHVLLNDPDCCNGVWGGGATGLDAASDPGGGNDTSQNSRIFALHAN